MIDENILYRRILRTCILLAKLSQLIQIRISASVGSIVITKFRNFVPLLLDLAPFNSLNPWEYWISIYRRMQRRLYHTGFSALFRVILFSKFLFVISESTMATMQWNECRLCTFWSKTLRTGAEKILECSWHQHLHTFLILASKLY